MINQGSSEVSIKAAGIPQAVRALYDEFFS